MDVSTGLQSVGILKKQVLISAKEHNRVGTEELAAEDKQAKASASFFHVLLSRAATRRHGPEF